MADNVELNAGSGGATIAADDISSVWHQRVKISLGADGSATDALGGAGAVAAGVQRVTLASDDPAVVALQILDNIVSGSEAQVDVVAALPAGDNNIGNVDIVSLPALAAGTNNIGDVDVLSVIPGTGATSLGKAEDAAHSSGDVGVMALVVRQDSQSDLGADGDYVPMTVDGDGGLRVSIVAGAGSGGTAAADDADFTAGTTSGTPIMGSYQSSPTAVTDGDLGIVGITEDRELKVSVTSGGVSGIAEDSAAAGGEEGIMVLAVRRDSASSGVGADGDFAALSVTSDGSLRTAISNTVTVASHAVTNAGTFATQVDGAALTALQLIDNSAVADDAAFTPGTTGVTMAGFTADEGSTDSVDEGDAGAARMTLDRKQIVTPYVHAAAGGWTPFRNIDVDESEDEVKGSAGKLGFLHVMNMAATVRYLKIYNDTAANVTVGTTTPTLTIPIPSNGDTLGAGFTISFGDAGLAFSTAITIAATTAVADNDTGAPGANEVIVNGGYL